MKQYKPFDLEQALHGAKVITRDGRQARLADYNSEANESECIVGWVNGNCVSWYKNGTHMGWPGSSFDLFMAPEKKEWWIGLFRKDGVTYNVLGINVHDLNEIALADLAEVLFIGKVYEEEDI